MNKATKVFYTKVLIFVLVIALVIVGIVVLKNKNKSEHKEVSSGQNASVEITAKKEKEPETVTLGDYTLNAEFSNLLLVNGENPLPDDYDYEGNLIEIDSKYIGGSLTQFDKDVYPYLVAMIENAKKDGVSLRVWSPYRSYAIQKMLFDKQVNREIAKGTPAGKPAEDAAATVVARPGTSEHHTGLALDINMADDAFENTKEFNWLSEHAAEYGFILRYPKSKQDKTGVIYESWHYRFVGINEAKKIKASGLCLEEYLKK